MLYKEFGQDVPLFEQRAGWVSHAIKHGFSNQPAQHHGPQIPSSRLIAVLQAWDGSDTEIQAQIAQTRTANAAGYIVAFTKIDQSWQPQMIKWK